MLSSYIVAIIPISQNSSTRKTLNSIGITQIKEARASQTLKGHSVQSRRPTPKRFPKNIVVRRDDDNDLKRALMLEANGQRKRERPK